jgi:hypothetical protein
MGSLRSLVTAVAVAVLPLFPAPASAAEPHAHGSASAPAKLQLDHGRKWPTDEALRRGMGAIHELVHKAPAALHKGTAKAEAYAELGGRIEREAGRIVAECKLAPQADEQLHLVIAEIVAGTDAMKGAKLSAEGRGGLVKVAGALRNYGRFFDHPGWVAAAR